LTSQLAIRISGKAIAETALYIAIQKHKKKAIKYRNILEKIKPNIQLYNLINKINQIIQQLKNES